MILDFAFDNYKSFRDETALDFKVGEVDKHRERLISLPDLDVLPAAVIKTSRENPVACCGDEAQF